VFLTPLSEISIRCIFLFPTLYVWIASDHDVLPAAEGEFAEGEHID